MRALNNLGKIAILSGVLFFGSCTKEDSLDSKSILDVSQPERTELDIWLDKNFLDVYNMKVFYRADQYKTDVDRYLNPPVKESVMPAMKVVDAIWLKTYAEIAGLQFVKETASRELVLIGNANMNETATVTLGLAEQGIRITLFEVDLLDVTNKAKVKRYIHTIQHEYVHILNQKAPFDKVAFGKLTAGGYTGDWNNTTDAQAYAAGFITPYARSNEEEDFAEMCAAMLVDINAYNVLVDGISSATGKAAIRTKEAMVVDYFKKALKIDFYALCQKADENTNKVVAGN